MPLFSTSNPFAVGTSLGTPFGLDQPNDWIGAPAWNDAYGYGDASTGKLDAPASVPTASPKPLAQQGSPAGSDWWTGIGSALGSLGSGLFSGNQQSNEPGSAAYQSGLSGGFADLFKQMNQGGGYTGIPSQNKGGFDPWAGNPFAQSMAQNMIGNMNQLPQMTADVTNQIGQQMNQNANRNFQYEQARVQASLMADKLANDKAAVDAQLALAQGQQTFQSQQLAAQLKMASDQLAAQIEANKQQIALSNAKLAQDGQLGNKGLDVQAQTAAAQQAFQQQQLAQQGQLGNKQLDIQSQQGGSAADQLAFQKWLAQQQMAQQNSDRDQKNDLLALIMQNMGGGGGGTGGGMGGGTGGSGGGGAIGFTGPQGQYANMNINTGVTAGALAPSAIRSSVSAIEGQPGGGTMAGPRNGMTGAQQSALSQDMGAMTYAGGQAAGNEALRKFLPQNAQLDLASNNAKNGLSLGYGQFLAEQERAAAGRQQGQNSLYIELMNRL
jgi:hypothetical protein